MFSPGTVGYTALLETFSSFGRIAHASVLSASSSPPSLSPPCPLPLNSRRRQLSLSLDSFHCQLHPWTWVMVYMLKAPKFIHPDAALELQTPMTSSLLLLFLTCYIQPIKTYWNKSRLWLLLPIPSWSKPPSALTWTIAITFLPIFSFPFTNKTRVVMLQCEPNRVVLLLLVSVCLKAKTLHALPLLLFLLLTLSLCNSYTGFLATPQTHQAGPCLRTFALPFPLVGKPFPQTPKASFPCSLQVSAHTLERSCWLHHIK